MSIPARVLAAAFLAGAAAAQQNQFADWSWFSYGTGIGIGQFRVSAAGGVTEVLVPCGSTGFSPASRYWVVLRHDAVANNYQQVFVSPVRPESDPIVKIFAEDVLPAAGPEVVVVMRSGTVEIWNQASRTLSRTFSSGLSNVQSACLADVDRNGSIDAVLVGQTSLRAVDLTGGLLFAMISVGGRDVVAGQMDTDASLELACTDGRVVDVDTRTIQFHWQNGFGIDVEAGDIDNDGLVEVVACEDWNWVWSYDIDTQLPKWSIPTGDLDCIALANVDADANLEVLVGEGQWGQIEAYDTVTQARQWGINNPDSGVTSVACGDLDNDGQLEVIWGAGFASTGPDFLYVAGVSSLAIEWQSVDIGQEFVGPELGDIDGDGSPEMVVGTGRGVFGGPRLLVFDPVTRREEFLSGPLTTSITQNLTGVRLVDVDGDGRQEIALCAGNATVYRYNGGTLTNVWQATGSSFPGISYRHAEVADLDGNGTREVVLGSSQYVHVHDFASNTELWRSFFVGGQVLQLVVGQADADPGLELHALSEDGNIYVFDGATRTAQAIVQDGGVNRTAFALLPSGINGMLAGDQSGGVFAILHTGSSYQTLGPIPLVTGPIHGMRWIDGTNFWWLANGGRVRILDGITTLWSTADYGTGFGSRTLIDLGSLTLNAAGSFGLSSFDMR